MTTKKITISNTLILISLIFTIIGYINPNFINQWGINNFYFNRGDYIHWFIQIFTGTFLHSGILHFLMNSLFLYYFGNQLEYYIGKKKFLIFFISSTIFLGMTITYFSNGNTIGISGFAMALLSYYTALLYSLKNPEYKGGITAILINIGIGISPGISLSGHLFGSIYGLIYFLITKKKIRKI